MIELLARLEPGSGGALAQMQDSGKRQGRDMSVIARASRCVVCRGKGGWHLTEGEGAKAAKRWHWCSRCGGAKKRPETGGQTSTRAAVTDALMTPAYIASLLTGAPQHKLDAAFVHVLRDMRSGERLAGHLGMTVLHRQSGEWKGLTDERVSELVGGLAGLVVNELAQMPLTYADDDAAISPELQAIPRRIEQKEKYGALGMGHSQWFSTWKRRYERVFSLAYGWTGDVDAHMWRMHLGQDRETG